MITLTIILLAVAGLALFGALPAWPAHGIDWGYFPSGGLAVALVVVVVILLVRRI